jgi:type 1 glutamine amidotransferase
MTRPTDARTPADAWAKTVAKQIVEDARAPWGKGWDMLNRQTQRDAIAARILYTALGQSAESVSVETFRALLLAAEREAGFQP